MQFFIDDHEAVKGLRKVVDDVAHLGGNYEPSMPNLRRWTELRVKSQRGVCDGVVGSNEDQVEAAAVEHGTDAVVDGHETFDVHLPCTKMCRPLHLLLWKIMKWLDLILPTKV